jgi:hypothetical protein
LGSIIKKKKLEVRFYLTFFFREFFFFGKLALKGNVFHKQR